MSMMEEFLELQEKVAKLQKKLKEKEDEIDTKDEKIISITERLNVLTNEAAKSASDTRHYRSMVSVLESDKQNLERERNRLLKEIDSLNLQIQKFASMVETTNQTLQTKEESLLSKEKQLFDKDNLLSERDIKLEEFQKKFELISEEKVKKFEELSNFMEKTSNEKIELVEKLATLEKELGDRDQKIKKVKSQSRAAQDGLLGASMEIEKVREESSKMTSQLSEVTEELEKIKSEKAELERKFGITPKDLHPADEKSKDNKVVIKAKEIDQYREKIASMELTIEQLKSEKNQGEVSEVEEDEVFAKGTGTYKSISALIAHLKFKMEEVNRTLRIILPELSDIEKYGLKELFLSLPRNILKNLACNVDEKRDSALLELLKKENFRITNYQGTKLFALSVDNNTAALAVYDEKNDDVTGLFSNHEDLVRLLSQAIMNPFIKGVKLN